MTAVLHGLATALRRARFRLWIVELRLKLRRAGARLELDAPHGATLEERPVVRAFPLGEGGGVFRLRIGRDVRIRHRLTIELWAGGDNRLAIGSGGLIDDSVRVILRGGAIELGERCNVRDGAWLKSDGLLRIGSDVQIGQGCSLHCDRSLELDDWVVFAERVTALDSDHGFDGSDVHFRDQPLKVEPTAIGRNSFAATGAVILRGTRLGANCFVGANAVVRGGEFEPGSLLAGIPAEVVERREPST